MPWTLQSADVEDFEAPSHHIQSARSIASMEHRLRLWSGLVLFVFVATHFINHSLGLISVELLEGGRLVFLALWRNPLGRLLLYSALIAHVALVLWALYRRRHLRLPRWEIARLAMGLLMPVFLIPHIFGTQVLSATYGVNDSYAYVVAGMWVEHPESVILQSLLLVLAWAHGSMGVHFWLRFRPWYPRAVPWLRPLALLLPVFGLLGFAHAGRTFGALWEDPTWHAATFPAGIQEHNAVVLGWSSVAVGIFLSLTAATFAGRGIRALIQRRRGVVRLSYPQGRTVVVPRGMSVLEASRAAGIPHASVCGGRGRCTTCRSRIVHEQDALPVASGHEQLALQRIGAPPNVRLACQLRPVADLRVFPLVPATIGPTEGLVRTTLTLGTEQEIAILFADIRSFTQFAEHRFPYDVVYLLNRYFAAMGEAVERSGGHLDKFIGDGVMALFGIQKGPVQGCQDALRAAVAMSEALDALNIELHMDLHEPLRIGLGIHMGPVIVGEMGYGQARTVTAIGDAVNTASRLESMNKEMKSQLIVSEEVARRAGVDLSRFECHELEVRGRTEPLLVHVIPDAKTLGVLSR
ncbi:MAG: adenylate/guanylate cyclase domain-containing protein [Chloroflexota bacterium]